MNIDRLLTRGVVDVIQQKDLEEKLQSGKKLRIKFGIDPTGSDLHLGHAVPLRKLKQLQDAGHQIVLLFGTFTGKIGDPTGKDKLRQPLTDEEIAQNMATYLEQAGKILDIKNVEIVKNGDWLSNMTFDKVLELAGTFTASQMMQRDMFQKRIEKGLDINLVEFFYPLMQGYDSVAIEADVEIGGTDQLFNLMAGRQIQERFAKTPQNILTVPILEGTFGEEKMSKSLNNYIGLTESPREIYGKTMSIPDHLIWKYLELLTDIPRIDITEWITSKHPRDAKMALARELVTMLHSHEDAVAAQEEFIRMFAEKGLPDDIPEMTIPAGSYNILDVVTMANVCDSNSECRRMIAQGAVKWNDEKQEDLESQVEINNKEAILQVGKRKFMKIVAE
jgi:tyrosyl-tRNA synthetase